MDLWIMWKKEVGCRSMYRRQRGFKLAFICSYKVAFYVKYLNSVNINSKHGYCVCSVICHDMLYKLMRWYINIFLYSEVLKPLFRYSIREIESHSHLILQNNVFFTPWVLRVQCFNKHLIKWFIFHKPLVKILHSCLGQCPKSFETKVVFSLH